MYTFAISIALLSILGCKNPSNSDVRADAGQGASAAIVVSVTEAVKIAEERAMLDAVELVEIAARDEAGRTARAEAVNAIMAKGTGEVVADGDKIAATEPVQEAIRVARERAVADPKKLAAARSMLFEVRTFIPRRLTQAELTAMDDKLKNADTYKEEFNVIEVGLKEERTRIDRTLILKRTKKRGDTNSSIVVGDSADLRYTNAGSMPMPFKTALQAVDKYVFEQVFLNNIEGYKEFELSTADLTRSTRDRSFVYTPVNLKSPIDACKIIATINEGDCVLAVKLTLLEKADCPATVVASAEKLNREAQKPMDLCSPWNKSNAKKN